MRNNTPKPKKPLVREQWGHPKYENYERVEYPTPAPLVDETRITHPINGRCMSGWEFEKEVEDAKNEHGCWPAPEPSAVQAETKNTEINQIDAWAKQPAFVLVGRTATNKSVCMAA